MTNEEALEILDHNWTRLVNSDYTDIELGQAQDLAIKALEEKTRRHWGNWIITEVQCPKCFNYVEPDCCSNNDLTICPNCGADMRGGTQ